MNVVIIGFKSAGKSTIGPLLAERVGFSFDDLDRRLMEAVAQEAGETREVRGAYRRLGAERFREMERRLLAEAVKEHRLILSLGGGAAVPHQRQRRVARHADAALIEQSKRRLRR